MTRPRVSIVIPYHDGMPDIAFFLKRCIDSVMAQTFQDYEIVLTKSGRMAENTNEAIKRARGEIIKIMYVDDYFSTERSLERIVGAFTGGWLATGCVHAGKDGEWQNPHTPVYNTHILKGINSIGSPSVVAFENDDPLLFDENLSWLLDAELYHRLHKRYGDPTILDEPSVVIGIHPGQTSNLMSDEDKKAEHEYINKKYKL